MEEFKELLQTWKGRHDIEAHLERQGFFLHKFYQDAVLDFCKNNGLECDVDVFWTEIAEEFIRSGGKVDSTMRNFYGPIAHKSEYLDRLWLSGGWQNVGVRPKSLHPCLRKLREFDRESNLEFTRSVNLILKKEKEHEALLFSNSSYLWNNEISDIIKFIDTFAEGLGFSKFDIGKYDRDLYKIGYCIRKSSNIIFYFGFENNHNMKNFSKLPFTFGLSVGDEKKCQILMDRFSEIVPGFEHYTTYRNSSEAQLGLMALVHWCFAMSENFGSDI